MASDSQPLLVKPKAACVLLGCGITRLYELLAAGELESFLDGRSRKITVGSIENYIARRLAANSSPAEGNTARPVCHRTRSRKRDVSRGAVP
jgi:hypothetical protein